MDVETSQVLALSTYTEHHNVQLSTVKLLLQHGAEIEARDVNGRRAVELAAILGHEDIGCLLTGKKQQERDALSGNEFFDVVKAGEVGRVREMLAQMPSLAHIVDQDGATPLMFAANKGHVEVSGPLVHLCMHSRASVAVVNHN